MSSSKEKNVLPPNGAPNGTPKKGRLVKRQKLATRITHWIWAICFFFLLFSGLQIFNAHPTLHIGSEAGFEYDNSVLSIGAIAKDGKRVGITKIFGQEFDTSGFLGLSGTEASPQLVAFPAWATIPSNRDLATGRVVHFFFAWIFVGTLFVWLILSLRNRHLRKDLLPKRKDVTGFWRDITDHARLRFHHTTRYSPLQKLSYGGVLFVVFPMIILTGLSMSPGMNAAMPWMLDIFGGRQTARSLHFLSMALLVAFFFVHILMVVAAGPINELRSMITGRYRLSPRTEAATKLEGKPDE